MNKRLKVWIENNLLDIIPYIEGTDILDTQIGLMLEIKPIAKKLFDKDMDLLIYEQEKDGGYSHEYSQEIFDIVDKYNIEYFVYEFGGDFFYTKVGKSDLNIFRYIGNAFYVTKLNSAFLGVHGRYERMNGTRDYSDWCAKAKFLGHKTLGICEKGTLAGILQFQLACTKAKIKPIIGATIELQSRKGDRYELKVYVENEQGWINLLKINKYITITNDGYITDIEFYGYCSLGLTVVIVPSQFSINQETISQVNRHCINRYVQITTNKFKSEGKDRELLLAMKQYFDEYMMRADRATSFIPPVLICDAYCLDFEDVHIKGKLNEAAKIHQASTENHYYRSHEEIFEELEPLFGENDNRLIKIFKQGLSNTLKIAESCTFEIDLKSQHLPQYEMTKDEKKKFKTNNDLFDAMIDIKAQKIIKLKKYTAKQINQRIKTEVEVIKEGGFVNYFLILWDIVRWCESQNILTGPGRGSAAGSLVAYCLGITKLNPLDYDLLFERFLNKSRITSEFPDIDTDINSERRDEVIQYLKDRYGEEFVCRVGTYTTLQNKGVVKELCKLIGASNSKELNKITKYIDDENNESWQGLFKDAAHKMPLKGFVNENSDVIADCRLALNSIKSSSQHACATILIPKVIVNDQVKTIFEWLPMRKDDKGNLISEWEGEDLAKAGFLKEDLLSTQQMHKINCMFDLIKQNHNIQLTLEEIPLDDKDVYDLFCQGRCQDVFHFGSEGLTNYLKQLEPTDINDLIAAIALYRPGAMLMGAHADYVKYKKGDELPEYDYMMEEVTGETYGLYCYQEQIMRACQVLGGFDLIEADGIRKCLDGDTLMWTPEGYCVIKDLDKKSQLLTYCDKDYSLKVNGTSSVFYSGKKDCVKVITKAGKEIICTPDHRFYTNEGWKDASLLKGSYVMHELKEKYGTFTYDLHELYITIALITEGAVGGEYRGAFVNQDQRELSLFRKSYCRVFKNQPKEDFNKKSKCTHIYLSSDELIKLKIPRVLSQEKCLPDWTLKLSERLVKFVLAKLIDFDGYIQLNGRIGYSSKSKKMIQQVTCLIENCGVKTTFRQFFHKKYQEYYYEVLVLEQDDVVELIQKLKTYSYKCRLFDVSKIKRCDENYSPYFLPHNIWFPLVEKLIHATDYTRNEIIGKVTTNYLHNNATIANLRRIVNKIGSRNKILDFYFKKDTYWDEVVDVVEVGERDVYDFTMNYKCAPQAFANGILVHNSMGKKIKELMDSYKVKFIEGALNNGCPLDQANTIWDKLEVFSGYGFNKSHAAAYAITGYICNWIKVHYPMEFWTVTFDKADPDDLSNYVAETKALGSIEIVPVDINNSQQHFYADFENKRIFWSFDKIVQCGPTATQALIDIRNQKGKFFSLEEFYERVPKSIIKKPVVINLILSGAFDDVCNIDRIQDRLTIIKQYFDLRGEKLPEEFCHKSIKTLLFWELLQKDKSKLGAITYDVALTQSKSPLIDWQNKYKSAEQFYESCEEKQFVMVAGIVTDIVPRLDKHGRTYCDITISNGDRDILIRIFADIWLGEAHGYEHWRPQLETSKGRVLFITGIVSDWRNHRNLQTVMNGTGNKSKFDIL